MPASRRDIVIGRGVTFGLELSWTDDDDEPIDLTGYSARMQVRASHPSAVKLLDLTSPGDITLGGALGTIAVQASAAATEALSGPQVAVYDLEVQDGGGVVTRLVEGRARITREALLGTRIDILIEQGGDFELPLVLSESDGSSEPFDLTGYLARLIVRESWDSEDALLELSSAAGDITLGGVAGTIDIAAGAAVTAALDAPVLGIFYLELESAGGVISRPAGGLARITPEVTR